MSRKISQANKTRFANISELGCIICSQPCEIHHCKGHIFGSGTGLKSEDKFTIGLCPDHHRGANGFHQIGKKTWEEKYGTQSDLLAATNNILEAMELIS